MNEWALSLMATVAGLVYVLTYAWAQLEILSHLIGAWQRTRNASIVMLGVLWAGMNCFAFLIAHDVHFACIRQGRLVLFEREALWARTVAALVIISYWTWVGGSFYFAIRRSRKQSERQAEP